MVKVLKTNLTLKTCPLGASFSSFGCFVFDLGIFVFEFLGALFSSLGCFVFEIWVLRASVCIFEYFGFETFWVLLFRVLGASFSRFGCFVLRSSFSSASFSKLFRCFVFDLGCFVFEI